MCWESLIILRSPKHRPYAYVTRTEQSSSLALYLTCGREVRNPGRLGTIQIDLNGPDLDVRPLQVVLYLAPGSKAVRLGLFLKYFVDDYQLGVHTDYRHLRCDFRRSDVSHARSNWIWYEKTNGHYYWHMWFSVIYPNEYGTFDLLQWQRVYANFTHTNICGKYTGLFFNTMKYLSPW